MSEMMTFPHQYQFKRSTRIMQFVRAFIVIAVGVGLVAARGYFNLSDNALPERILLYLGIFVAASGVIAVIILIFKLIFYKPQSATADENGLVYERQGANKQTLQWADVSWYEVDYGGEGGFDWLMTSSSSSSNQSGDAEILGCFLGIVLSLYSMLLQAFIGGTTSKVKFKLKTRRTMSVSGTGSEMDELIELLPRFLPDKRKQPGDETKKSKKNEKPPDDSDSA